MKKSQSPETPVLVYQADDGAIRVEVRVAGETVWLNQAQMAGLFQTTKQNVGLQIRNVFAEGELTPESVVKDFFTTAADGKQYRTRHYNLDVIISAGYRVKSLRGTQFRIWVAMSLRQYRQLKAQFITCYQADNSIGKIRAASLWEREACLAALEGRGGR